MVVLPIMSTIIEMMKILRTPVVEDFAGLRKSSARTNCGDWVFEADGWLEFVASNWGKGSALGAGVLCDSARDLMLVCCTVGDVCGIRASGLSCLANSGVKKGCCGNCGKAGSTDRYDCEGEAGGGNGCSTDCI